MSGFQITCAPPVTVQPPVPVCTPPTTPATDICTSLKAIPTGTLAVGFGLNAAGACVQGPLPAGTGTTTPPAITAYVTDVVIAGSSLAILYGNGTTKNIDLCAAIQTCTLNVGQINGLLAWLQSQAITAAQVSGLCAAVAVCTAPPPCTTCASQPGLALPTATAGVFYQQDILLSGGTPFALGVTILPLGLSATIVTSIAGPAVRISGTPAQGPGAFAFSVTFTNCSAANTCTLTGTIPVVAAPCAPVTTAAIA